MTRSIPARLRTALSGLALVALAASAARAEVLDKSRQFAGVTVQYKVVLPAGYDASKSYPAIIALGGGPQTMNTVDGVLNRNLRAEAEKRGYIVIAPAAPNGELFFESGARIFPEFLKAILADYKIQDGKFHIAGPSNGGIAAFHVAAANPQYFLSVTAFPGYMWQPSAGQAAGHFEDVRVHVRRRERRLHVARRDEARGRVPALARRGGALHRGEGPASPHRDAGGRQRIEAVRRVRGNEEGLLTLAGSRASRIATSSPAT